LGIEIDDVEIFELPEDEYVVVYNFEVTDSHSYFVSKFDVLVHNRCNVQVKKFTQYTGNSPIGEVHHGLPEQYSKWFGSRVYNKNKMKIGQTIDINSGEFYYDLPKGLHRLKSGHGIHTKSSYTGKNME